MPITFHPHPGTVLICDFFTGFQPPEMVKRRHVVVVSPRRRRRRSQADGGERLGCGSARLPQHVFYRVGMMRDDS